MHLHLIDGTYELFRAYFAAPSLTSPTGKEVGATRVLMSSLLGLLKQPDVTHVACAFDHVIESFRNDLFPGYKTGEGIEPALLEQFELAERATYALGITTWPMLEFEADDALATAATRYANDPRVARVFICSPDKDLTQCVTGERIVLWDRARKKILDEPAVCEKFGVPPRSIPDYLALVGDTADGIPGVPAWGAKSAALLLSAYQTIDAIPADPGTWSVSVRGANKLAQSLNAHREEARLYKLLATLRLDVPLAENVDDLAWHGARKAELSTLCNELGFDKLLGEITTFRD